MSSLRCFHLRNVFLRRNSCTSISSEKVIWPSSDINGKKTMRSAAVLVPLIDNLDEMSVLLTLRSASLPDHPGQVAFPGGKVEACDASPEETALREAKEEVGLGRQSIDLLGRLNPHDTQTGFSVMPVVGVVNCLAEPVPDPREVDTIFEVPLPFICDHNQFKRYDEKEESWTLQYGSYFVSGLTARILYELSTVLRKK